MDTKEEYVAGRLIKCSKVCNSCPLRIYAKDNTRYMLGTGNRFSDVVIILPPYDITKQNMFHKLRQEYFDIYGRDILEDVYVTRSAKCVDKGDYNLINTSSVYCLNYLFAELRQIAPHRIINCDRNIDSFLDGVKLNAIKYFKCISPAVLFYDNEDNKQRFREELTKALMR